MVSTAISNTNTFLFVLSVNDMLGNEVMFVLKNLSGIMAAKMDEPISHVRGWINIQIAILVTSSYSQIIHVDLLLTHLRERDPEWDPASGIGLAQ